MEERVTSVNVKITQMESSDPAVRWRGVWADADLSLSLSFSMVGSSSSSFVVRPRVQLEQSASEDRIGGKELLDFLRERSGKPSNQGGSIIIINL